MSSKYIKAVRTRYRNTLQKEITTAKTIFSEFTSYDIPEENREEFVNRIDKCIEKLKMYREKVEAQSEKMVCALDETEDFEKILNDDSNLCDESEELFLDLKGIQNKFARVKDSDGKAEIPDTTVTAYTDKLVTMQQEMQRFMLQHSHEQMEFMKKQEEKGKSSSVKLPKLDIVPFDGNKLKWREFWDTFSCTVHMNTKLCDIEKFSYLQSKLVGKAKEAIAGLELSGANYVEAIAILKDRFGNAQEIITLHYNRLMNLPPPNVTTRSLRSFLDSIEKNLRSLEVLKQDINQDVFISMMKSKLPKEVLLELELRRPPETNWTVQKLREYLRIYIVARERTEQNVSHEVQEKSPYIRPVRRGFTDSNSKRTFSVNKNRNSVGISSAEALVTSGKVTSDLTNKGYSDKCRYCEKHHWSDECLKYRTIQDRKQKLKDSCYRCLKVGHTSTECRRNKICVHCRTNNKHHRSLCPVKFPATTLPESVHITEEITSENGDEVQNEEKVLVSSGEIVLMQTAKVEVKHPHKSISQHTRLLLDCGSQRTYITENLATKLGLKKEEEIEIKLVTFGSSHSKTIRTRSTKLNLKLKDGNVLQINANIVPCITGQIHRTPLPTTENMNVLIKSLDMADTLPTKCESTTVELLLGNDYYLDVVLPQRIEVQPGLYCLASKLGWILTGRTGEDAKHRSDISMLVLTYGTSLTASEGVFTGVDKVMKTKPDLEDFWSMESIGVTDEPEIEEDKRAMENFRETVTCEEGRYSVTWPWKTDDPDLPQNRELAIGRLRSNVSRLKNNTELLKKYDSVIQDQLQKGVIEKIDENTSHGIKHYLPHHAVINPLKPTTALRVVYDASAKTRAEHQSLNDCLYRGPVLLGDLCGILLRFRTHRIAIVADIEKAFLQVGLRHDQRDATRFLWIKDCDNPSTSNENIQEFRFCRVPFGVISSPFLLGATINYHLSTYSSSVSEKVKDDIYVDNLVTGTDTVDSAKELYSETKAMFEDASMNLREWMSNNRDLNEFIPYEDRMAEKSPKLLGYIWNSESDTLSLNQSKVLKEDYTEVTKRNVLKQLASVYDPLGLFSPICLRGKMLLQTIWQQKFDWDDEIDAVSVKRWHSVKSDLLGLSQCEFPRCAVLDGDGGSTYSLICFCDASKDAYAAAIYLRQCNGKDSTVQLVFSKTRLAPIKSMSIPRLELMAVLVGVRCLTFVKSQLGILIEKVYLWSDSQCVLSWITTEKTLSVFVQNRVKEIRQHKDVTFCYISSTENPENIASRGSLLQNLINNELWWRGPSWLKQPESSWLTKPSELEHASDTSDFASEVKHESNKMESNVLAANETSVTRSYELSSCSPFEIDTENYSSVIKLLRVTAFALRFVKRVRKLSTDHGSLTSSEINEAEKLWLHHIQKKHFSDILHDVAKKKRNNLQQQLGLFIDNDGLLRCHGRLEHSCISEGSRFPILLPQKDRLTHLLIDRCHKQNLHSGVSQTLSAARTRYWIPRGRATVKSVISRCGVCCRHEGGSYKLPLMSPLPTSRVSVSVPFTRIGLDYLGPLYIRSHVVPKKVWVCLFTCMTTRAVHLEIVLDASTEEFLLAFRRFIATRGKPIEILSDNASQFKTASATLDRVWYKLLRNEEVLSYVANEGIKWKFIVEMAPWMGGFYERLVGIVKRTLRKSIGRRLNTLIQLQTLIKEIEAVVNSRPLVYVTDDVNSNIALCPRHFLSLNPYTGIPESDYSENDPDYIPNMTTRDQLLEIWKKGQKLLNVFWKVWRDEYLLSLRERTQSRLKSGRIKSKQQPEVGDIVLIKDDLPRGCWKIAKIIHLAVSRDGHIRSAKVQQSTGKVLRRPLNLLFPIECSQNFNDQNVSRNVPTTPSKLSEKPGRKAAFTARTLIKQQLN